MGADDLKEAMAAADKAFADGFAANEEAIPERPAFDGSAVLAAELDVEQVRELAAEVRKSYLTFKEVVKDNGLYRMNPSAFNQYCNDLAEDAKQATLGAGAASMDAHQVDEFCKAIGELEKE